MLERVRLGILPINYIFFIANCPIAVENSYDGPRLDEGKVTPEFMTQLMEWFRNQKGLHRKYAYMVSN
jgi:hypothetical protein